MVLGTVEAMTDVEARAAEAARDRDLRVGPATRRRHGVVHTPPVLCRYVAAAAQEALRALDLATGFGDRRVTLIDPACGPGGFLAAAWAVAAGAEPPAQVLACDRDEAALETAADVLGAAFASRGWPLTRQAGDTLASLPPTSPVAVVLGNPPWAGRAASRAACTDALLEDFRRDGAGEPLRERKVGVLSDSYVRFWRWAAEVVRRSPEGGVVGFVTNGSFLDGPVHRGMRAALARFFDRIDVVDLGGSALVAQGARDENVFGVRPSVAVTIAARGPRRDEGRPGVVQVAALRGRKDDKLEALRGSLRFEEVASDGPWRLAPAGSAERWPHGWRSLDALFPFHREGVQTNRDAVVVADQRDVLGARLQSFALGLQRPDLEPAMRARRHYDPERARAVAQAALQEDPAMERLIQPLAYRPWDDRWMIALAPLCHRPRHDLARAMARSSVALLTVRKDRGERPWAHFGVSRVLVDNCYLSARSSCRTRAFPTHDPAGRPNLSELARSWERDPERLVHHALAVLASATYRSRFDWLLRQGYPAIPPPTEATVEAGRRLAELWLGDGPRREEASLGHWTVMAPVGFAEATQRCDAAVGTLVAAGLASV